MISEPELEGEDGPYDGAAGRSGRRTAPPLPGQRSGDGPGGSGLYGGGPGGDPAREPVVVADGAPGPVPRRAALTWAVWGALAASVLWGAGLYAYRASGPDLGGYGAERNLCLDAPLPALSKELGRTGTPEATSDETAAVDSAACRTDLGPAPRDGPFHGPTTNAGPHSAARALVDLTYVLHRKTDPAPEFDALPAPKSPGSELHALRVPGLGERAYLITDTVGDLPPTLRVLDGRAEFTLSVTVYSSYDGHRDAAVDLRPQYVSAHVVATVLEPAMADDLRQVMRTVKSGG
ncbi:hypothetical protein [Streptomyces sp. NRRL F-5126]|uniref:hypothetical protein n=1 Tax=Streptomyces sp. NRRL F-5126 TaxID=1463857 RepID=UPI00068CFA4E|nr:hypothetical protein [Streptomyces sp. NRRL F-5126]